MYQSIEVLESEVKPILPLKWRVFFRKAGKSIVYMLKVLAQNYSLLWFPHIQQDGFLIFSWKKNLLAVPSYLSSLP